MSDEVDGVVDAWERARPDLNLDPMHIWSRIDRLAAILEGHRKHAFSDHSIEGWEFDVLAALRRAGEPHRLSPGQLIKETHVTSGTVTNRVDRLVKRGLVTRESDPRDGRGVLVALAPAGSELVDAALTSLLGVEQELLSGWPEDERRQLTTLLRRLLLGSA
ncbi:DNA-binding transcriptional regulator, MarR family [Tessaracoccus bendigoensis DSM 12906]|uniref:DNA-binding transcriptional regulator, MarR family n=1 Tax=Tessaracoccus bendigoensis DSM 12906 TaxID=1123357 RepID=A0A1M6MTY8_9ACTN|nr:MarR family transcriptional regulator [Tessaracoccus bendigoensis]SHJ86978.1 DNA-binding transcriptional regulator, MarR family [Tessaracoccus bendigoensis DSM 12906]